MDRTIWICPDSKSNNPAIPNPAVAITPAKVFLSFIAPNPTLPTVTPTIAAEATNEASSSEKSTLCTYEGKKTLSVAAAFIRKANTTSP